MGTLPATGTTIRMGGVYTAYTNITPVSGTNIIRLNATLGVTYAGVGAGATTRLSATFGSRVTPFTYPG
jgi:hypothetical protein